MMLKVAVCLLVYIVNFCLPKPATSYCVTPNESIPCPTRCNQSCHVLDYYTTQQKKFFDSEAQFIFINGTHNHIVSTSIENMTSLIFSTLNGEKDAVISCSHRKFVGFVFKNIVSVSIHNINFTGCGQAFSFKNVSNYATLAFLDGGHLAIDSVNISNSIFQGLMIVGFQKSVSIRRSLFINATHELNNSFIAGNSLNIFQTVTEKKILCANITIENSSFVNNINRMECAGNGTRCKCKRFAPGLTFIIRHKYVNIRLNKVFFDGNLGCRGGNMALIFYSNLMGQIHITKCIFQNGNATFGGAMAVSFVGETPHISNNSTCSNILKHPWQPVIQISDSTFMNNSATWMGGALHINLRETNTFAYKPPVVVNISNCTFIGNALAYQGIGGVAIHYTNYISFKYQQRVLPQLQLFIKETNFANNINNNSRWDNSGSGVILLRTVQHTEIEDITIYGNSYSGIFMVSSNLIISGPVHIYNNTGSSGGGMLFCSSSVMYLKPNATLNVSNNHVIHAGGGICVEEQCLQSKPICFFQESYEMSTNSSSINSIKVILKNNSADYAGDQIYGGSIDFCFMLESPNHDINDPPVETSIDFFKQVFDVDLNINSTTSITSPQRRVCLCNTSTLVRNCSLHSAMYHIYPGDEFNITVAVVGQLNGTVPGTVYSHLQEKYNGIVKAGNRVQKINATCNNLKYTIYSTGILQENLEMELGIQFAGDESFAYHLSTYDRLKVPFSFKRCPIGFELQNSSGARACECHSKIKTYFSCDIGTKTMKLQHRKKAWIGIDGNTLLVSHGWVLDYCTSINISTDDSTIMNQNGQCRFNRSGILCGSCSENFSVALGSSKCLSNCSAYHLFLIPIFALAGLMLVILIAVFNFTVAEGTTNGLIFYANVLHISENYFFQGNSIKVLTPILRAFIAWLNLDLGIPTCLYKGMDDYAKAWLQFVFPLYIWFITGFIIILSKHFHFATRLVKRNGVKVLATLVLLSYSKMIRASVNAFHPKYIHHISIDDPQSDIIKLCWIMDCNIPYLEGKHIVLFSVGVLTCAVLIPFTLILLFIDQLNKFSNFRCFSWVWKLKPFFDSYTGPYTNEGRFWTGLLCTARVVLILARNLNDHKNGTLNTVLANAIVILFLISPWILRSKVYKKRWLNILECSFMLNIGILSLATLYEGSSYIWLTHLSVGIAFITFLAVTCYQILSYFNFIQRSLRALQCLKAKVWKRSITKYHCSESDYDDEKHLGTFPSIVRFNEDREPLLAIAERDD